jgi:alkylation response protein AidB-like acyl-CoA dehydrogenase
VDLNLTSDQELFVQTSRRFIETSYPLTAVRDHIGGYGDAGADYRLKAAELGWFAMLVPEELGGGSVSGNGVLDAALVAQARGAALQPGPFVGTNVVALALSEGGGADEHASVLSSLVSGEAAATWATSAPGGDGAPDAGVRAERAGDGYRLSGTKTLVQDADRAAWLLVTAAGAGGPAQFLVAAGTVGVRVRPLDGLDLTRRFCEVTFEGVELPPSALVGQGAHAGTLVERQLQLACVLTTAESIGAMDHDLQLAVQYAKDRTAFGRPIGSFQAIKHLLADTSLMLEMSKGIVTAAVEAMGAGREDAGSTASMAKAFVGDCGIDLAQNCFQVFGGIGYTWEHDQHLFLRRLTTDAALYGGPEWHRERLCRLSGV